MPPPKGTINNPKGRTKGVPNKATTETREAFKNLLELNTPNMIRWMEEVAAKDPAKALSLCVDLAEFVVPKLQRAELTGKDGGAIQHNLVADDDGIIARFLGKNGAKDD